MWWDPVRYRHPLRFLVVLVSVALYCALPAPYHYAAWLPLTASLVAVFASALEAEE